MAYKTNISWAEATWNILSGCSPCSPGCMNCAAARSASTRNLKNHPLYKGLTKNGKWTGEIRLCTDIGRQDILEKPLHWRKPRKIFVEFMGDLFHEKVPFEFIDRVYAIAALCPQHIFMILTKRVDRALEYYCKPERATKIMEAARTIAKGRGPKLMNDAAVIKWPDDNVHFGVSISTQDEADKKIPIAMQIQASQLYISFEPLLEGEMIVPFKGVQRQKDGRINESKIDYIIIGAESKGAAPGRECKVEWVRSLVKQAQAAGVKCHVKQLHLWGTSKKSAIHETEEDALWIDGGKAKRYLIKDINKFPEELRIREV